MQYFVKSHSTANEIFHTQKKNVKFNAYGKRSIVESIVGVILEEIRVALVSHRRVHVFRDTLPVFD